MCDCEVCKIQYSHSEMLLLYFYSVYTPETHMLSKPFSIKMTLPHSLSLSAEQQAFQ